jgi:hypothetical protein
MRRVGQRFRTVKLCTGTAIAPDGRRSMIEVEAKSRNNAVFVYNYRASTDPTLLRPDFSTVFEITPACQRHLKISEYRNHWAVPEGWADKRNQRVLVYGSRQRAVSSCLTYSGGPSLVTMMKTADLRDRDNRARIRRLHTARFGTIFL